MRTSLPVRRFVFSLCVLLVACELPNAPDGGTGGGGATGGGATGGGATGGGATGGGATAGGGGGGSPGDGGVVIFGELCDATLAQGLINSCRLEPYNPYAANRCLNAQYLDGGFLSNPERTALINQGSVEACAMFGAALLRCLAPIYPTCEAIRADGGFSDNAVIARLDACTTLLGERFDTPCSTGCTNANDTCQLACNRMVAETCGPCFFECGRQHGQCMQACVVLPDAGYPDGG